MHLKKNSKGLGTGDGKSVLVIQAQHADDCNKDNKNAPAEKPPTSGNGTRKQ